MEERAADAVDEGVVVVFGGAFGRGAVHRHQCREGGGAFALVFALHGGGAIVGFFGEDLFGDFAGGGGVGVHLGRSRRWSGSAGSSVWVTA